METANKTLENLAKLKEMFPEVITESKDENGEIVAAVDAKKLEQLLSTKVIEGDECYDFTWVGKKQAMVEACKPIRKTLRPCREESVNWENTQNLYIEGDNLDVLKLLQESYLNKIKMIYIDPPYNTGNDSFIYPDDYKTNKDQYDEEVGAIDESGYRMYNNTKDKGHFHSSWCSMIYSRLKLARNLLTDDGVIFISIDDNEVDNMRKICDEVFGESNFVATLKWKKKKQPSFLSKVADVIEYIHVYSKDYSRIGQLCAESLSDSDKPVVNASNKISERIIRKGTRVKADLNYIPKGVVQNKTAETEYLDDVNVVDGRITKDIRIKAKFRTNQEGIDEFCRNDLLFITKNLGLRRDLSEDEKSQGKAITDLLLDWGQNQDGTNEVKELFSQNGDTVLFTNPKPVLLLKNMTKTSTDKDSIVLDFFSGSATTAHAVMQLNAEDGGNRKFIMVQLPEVCDEKSEAYKAGYKNICEIGKERIRRAGKKIVEETGKKDLDIGFRVLKLDESNMKDVYFTPEEYKQTDLVDMVSNIKEDRTPEDLLYACMLEWGLELSLPHKVENIAGYNVHIVNNGDLVACFADKISEDAIKQIAEMKPLRAVFRDSSFATDAARVNVGEIFKLKSPNTTIKVL